MVTMLASTATMKELSVVTERIVHLGKSVFSPEVLAVCTLPAHSYAAYSRHSSSSNPESLTNPRAPVPPSAWIVAPVTMRLRGLDAR